MAHFTKEQYEGKREYASKIATNNKEILISAGMNEEEADKLVELSHKRHELHCANGSELRELFDELGNQYSAGVTLIDEVNTIAEKYNLPIISSQTIPEVEHEDDNYLIAEYYDISEEELEANYDEYFERINNEWETAKNNTSKIIRNWFKSVNEKYNTEFPA